MQKYIMGSICEIISGGTPSTTEPSFWGGDINWISIADFINANRYVTTTEKTITQDGLNHSATTLLQREDLIVSARGTVGKVALIPHSMAFNQSCYGFRSKNPNILLNEYLFYWFKSNSQQLTNSSNGSVFDTITKNTFDNITINLPNTPTQRHIVNPMPKLSFSSPRC
ncbi:MAG: restriction endonuclease subunit S [Firmicutes bacterium]|nr:restriction endonuclease subunit S [Bacillota bacterium]